MKIAVAMSGGVDSSVVAKLLKDEGHELVGLFLKLWSDPTCNVAKENRCCNYEALEDARKVAHGLNIPFYVINAVDEFKKEVVDYFIDEHKKLNTPNPCIVCNEKIKFDLLLKKALSIGCEKLATGHYARIEDAGNPKSEIRNPKKLKARSYKLKAGVDFTKDQSYMLYRLDQNQLSKVLFPLGEMTKKQVRALAVKWDLPVKEKPESQEICFFDDKDYRSFLKRYLPEKYFKPGNIVDKKGNVLGAHEGLINYTIGQRKGIEQTLSTVIPTEVEGSLYQKEIATPSIRRIGGRMARNDNNGKVRKMMPKQPLYVIGFDVQKNQLVVGPDEAIYSREMVVSDLNWMVPFSSHPEPRAQGDPLGLVSGSLKVKIRYRHEAVPCRLKISNNLAIQQFNNLHVVFNEPQRAITPGQSAVFYLGDAVLGGGVIK